MKIGFLSKLNKKELQGLKIYYMRNGNGVVSLSPYLIKTTKHND